MPMYAYGILTALVAWAVAYLLTPVTERLAWKAGAVDHPRGRHAHLRPTALWGGVAIFAGAVAGTLTAVGVMPQVSLSRPIVGILLGATLVGLMGVRDDVKEMRAGPQLLGQLAAACLLLWFGVEIKFITNPFTGEMMVLGPWGDILTVLWVLGMTNTINWIDGVDGVAGGVSAITAATLGLIAVQMHQISAAMMAAAVCGAAIGFLRYNLLDRGIKVFMGSVGSQVLGFLLAAISILGALKGPATIAVAVPVLIFGVPLFDTAFVLLKRLWERRPIYEGDRAHLHHRLLARGLNKHQVVCVIYGLTATFCGLALLVFRMAR
ncbi:MAG: undecaprenyl/decaprenyl-phosphate alpha-N-acetylglucosaminyl 1-phosphate transferase [Armatimonadetes bacterium]|nr:undecaprenyl/decaprenyl-phosphate alpha-N-acetylglucosaminyl 1-phosphate transferase [Armatimonadota bacterium]